MLASNGLFGLNELSVEDNATVLLCYPKATGLAEASWTQAGNLSSYVASIHGTKASLIVETAATPERLLRADADHLDGREIDIMPSAEHLKSATHHLCWALANDQPLMPLVSAEVGRDAQSMLASAQLAAKQSGVAVV